MAKTAINSGTRFPGTAFLTAVSVSEFSFKDLTVNQIMCILMTLCNENPNTYTLTSIPNKTYTLGIVVTHKQLMTLAAQALLKKV